MTALDLALVLGLALRLSRLITTDDLGLWWVQWPLANRRNDYVRKQMPAGTGRGVKDPKWWKYAEGLECPFCVGAWLGALALLSLWLAGGPGHAAEWWRYGAGIFALNYLVGHIASRLDS